MSLAQDVRAGNRLALARALTHVENDTPEGRAVLDALYAHTGHAHLVGVTGAPGTGKSSLVNQLALHYRKAEKKVAIIAVDPSSPFTGGAVLGDRVRMRDLSGDTGVFIRSMASRGSLGGLAATTAAAAQVFDAAGFDVVLIETVGAGQSEVDVARLAHTTLVVEAPGLGDDIQAIKAGILEIADLLIINKADRPGVENTERALKTMLDLAHPVQKVFLHHGERMQASAPVDVTAPMWVPPVLRTVATEAKGIPEALAAIDQHATHLRHSGEWQRREQARLETELELLLRDTLYARFQRDTDPAQYKQLLATLFSRQSSPREVVRALLHD